VNERRILFYVNRTVPREGEGGVDHVFTWEELPVNLDALSPFARAVAERLTTTYNGRLPADFTLVSSQTLSEMHPETGQMWDGYRAHTRWYWDSLHDYPYPPVCRLWQGERPPSPPTPYRHLYGPGRRETPESYIERHAAEMRRLGWTLEGYDEREPARAE
jgi:hypothetical protein